MSLKVRVAIALCLAALSAAIVAGYASSVRSEAAGQRAGALARYGGETAAVCVSSRDISRGEVFSERNVEVAEWLVDLLPEGALDDPGKVIGMTAASAVAANTPLASVDIEAREEALEVPAGLVAVSLPCSDESAVGGAVAPGSRADVYVVSDGSAHLLCQEVEVLRTNAAGTMASLAWATVAVRPDEVEALIAASSLHRLHLVLPSEEELARRAALEEAAAERRARDGLSSSDGAAAQDAEAPGGEAAAPGGPDAAEVAGAPAGAAAVLPEGEGVPAEALAADAAWPEGEFPAEAPAWAEEAGLEPAAGWEEAAPEGL